MPNDRHRRTVANAFDDFLNGLVAVGVADLTAEVREPEADRHAGSDTVRGEPTE